jgi:cobalt/nickel transport system permease protein
MIFSRRKNNFIENSIMGTLSFLKGSVFADEYALKKGFLQGLDPRIKTLTFLLFIIQILFTKNIAVIIGFYAVCLGLAYFSEVRLGFFLKRTWVFIPLFSLFIAIPAMFSVFTPGETLAAFNLAGLKFIITREGLSGAAFFVARVMASVSFTVLLSITTRHFELLKVLRIFKVPQVFVMVIGMCYRYIYLFVEMIENTYTAIKSRVGLNVGCKKGQKVVAWNIASLWARSYQLNGMVYNAMLARGYTGEPVVFDDFKARTKDWGWLIFTVAVCISLGYLTWLK